MPAIASERLNSFEVTKVSFGGVTDMRSISRNSSIAESECAAPGLTPTKSAPSLTSPSGRDMWAREYLSPAGHVVRGMSMEDFAASGEHRDKVSGCSCSCCSCWWCCYCPCSCC